MFHTIYPWPETPLWPGWPSASYTRSTHQVWNGYTGYFGTYTWSDYYFSLSNGHFSGFPVHRGMRKLPFYYPKEKVKVGHTRFGFMRAKELIVNLQVCNLHKH